jgi:hypothetical protein
MRIATARKGRRKGQGYQILNITARGYNFADASNRDLTYILRKRIIQLQTKGGLGK